MKEEQVQEIKNHIALVLKKETPDLKTYYTSHVASGWPNKNSDIFPLKIYDHAHTDGKNLTSIDKCIYCAERNKNLTQLCTDHICNRLNKTGSCNYCDERERKTEEYNLSQNLITNICTASC